VNYAVIFAGGIGARMGGDTLPKQFMEVAGKPVLIHTLQAFDASPLIDGISVVCLESWIPFLEEKIREFGIQKVRWVSPGAQTGQQSIYQGLKAVFDQSTDPARDLVLINDGVRPFISGELIERCIRLVQEKGSAVTICPVPETIVTVPEVDDHLENEYV